MTPMSNALGYAQNKRTEEILDPNRDFPFLKDASQCMTTIVGRVLNEIFREYLVQLAMTFHGGMRAISYEWGGPNHPTPRDYSPDHIAQQQMAQQMQVLGGHLHSKWFYPIGTLNKVVYPVKGGMEDWAYTGSWDKGNVHPCRPTTYNRDGIAPYPKERTIYNDAQLRSFNFLIEASDIKTPRDGWGKVGDSWDTIWNVDDSEFDGHIPRNMRISMFLINSAQTYVMIRSSPKTVEFDVEKNIFIGNQDSFTIQWMVSGAMSVYDYDLMFTLKEDQNNEDWNVLKMQKNPNWRRNLDVNSIDKLKNKEWKFLIEESTELTVHVMRQIAKECIGISADAEGKRHCPIWMNVRVKVDDQWMDNRDLKTGQLVRTYPQGVGPQSHVGNARNMNEDDWNMKNNKFFVKASEWWMAETPIRVDVTLQGNTVDERITTAPAPHSIAPHSVVQPQLDEITAVDDATSVLVLKIIAPMCLMALAAFCFLIKQRGSSRLHDRRTYQRVSTSLELV